MTNDREFNYVPASEEERAIAKGGVTCPFPWRLHEMLKVTSEEGLEDIVSWVSHGRAFTVHKPKEFAKRVLPRFFSQTKYPSFQRQLNLYGFNRFAQGKDKGAYYHLCFIKGHRSLVVGMVRRKIKGTKVRRVPTEEPNFYDPAWKNHFEPTIPPGLTVTSKVVTPSLGPKAVNPASVTSHTILTPTSSAPRCTVQATSTPYVDILPAPPREMEPLAHISDEESSWESLGLDGLVDDEFLLFDFKPFNFLDNLDLSMDAPALLEDPLAAPAASL